MGIIFSRFRRKKNTDEILEDIQSDIQSLEENRDLTLQRQKYLIGRLYIYSILVYIVGAIIFYFFYFPVSLADRMFYLMPLLIFPVIVILLKKLISWYYKREISQSKSKLAELKSKKKQILEDVMNKETYKVAKEILEKYAPEQLKKTAPTKTSPPQIPTHCPESSPNPQNDNTPKSLLSTPVALNNEQQKSFTQTAIGSGPPALALPAPPGAPSQKPMGPRLLQRQPSPQRRLVRPIIPRERNFIDKIIESIVGDGPNNRYALICRNCAGHNGMALKEDFDYLAFRCAYCGFPNPAQKVRPRHRIHEVHDRTPSEVRRSTDGESDKRTEQNEEDKTIDKGNVKINDSTNEDDNKSESKIIDSKDDDERSSIGEAGSSDDSSAPTDGVRPRKPLHLADD